MVALQKNDVCSFEKLFVALGSVTCLIMLIVAFSPGQRVPRLVRVLYLPIYRARDLL